jgi:hypothetical protein
MESIRFIKIGNFQYNNTVNVFWSYILFLITIIKAIKENDALDGSRPMSELGVFCDVLKNRTRMFFISYLIKFYGFLRLSTRAQNNGDFAGFYIFSSISYTELYSISYTV